MKPSAKKWRFCKAIDCEYLKELECELEKCEHPDQQKTLIDRRREIREVKHGGNS